MGMLLRPGILALLLLAVFSLSDATCDYLDPICEGTIGRLPSSLEKEGGVPFSQVGEYRSKRSALKRLYVDTIGGEPFKQGTNSRSKRSPIEDPFKTEGESFKHGTNTRAKRSSMGDPFKAAGESFQHGTNSRYRRSTSRNRTTIRFPKSFMIPR